MTTSADAETFSYPLGEHSRAHVTLDRDGQWTCTLVWCDEEGEQYAQDTTSHASEDDAVGHARAALTEHETDPSWGSCGRCGHDECMRPERDSDPLGPSDCTYCDTVNAITDDAAYAFATGDDTPLP